MHIASISEPLVKARVKFGASLRDQGERENYSGSMICPLTAKFPSTEGTPVPG